MPWIRRRADGAGTPGGRLPDLEFLALVRANLEDLAPGVTHGALLRGNSLIHPNGWGVAAGPPRHGGDHHYEMAALPDVNDGPEVPVFLDRAVAATGEHRGAAHAWTRSAGACLLELLDRRGRFAEHHGPGDERGVPGRHAIASGVVGLGADDTEPRRVQRALLDANVLHRVAGTLTAGLDPSVHAGIKVFYGGGPGAAHAEVRVDGEHHPGRLRRAGRAGPARAEGVHHRPVLHAAAAPRTRRRAPLPRDHPRPRPRRPRAAAARSTSVTPRTPPDGAPDRGGTPARRPVSRARPRHVPRTSPGAPPRPAGDPDVRRPARVRNRPATEPDRTGKTDPEAVKNADRAASRHQRDAALSYVRTGPVVGWTAGVVMPRIPPRGARTGVAGRRHEES